MGCFSKFLSFGFQVMLRSLNFLHDALEDRLWVWEKDLDDAVRDLGLKEETPVK